MTVQEKIDKRIDEVGGAKKMIEGLIKHYPAETEEYGCIFEGFILARYKPWDKLNYKERYRTALSNDRMFMIDQYSTNMQDQFPDAPMAEFGVYKGGVTRMLLDKGNRVFAFDTFEGIRKSDKSIDEHEDGDYDASGSNVEEYIKDAIMIKGTIPSSLNNFRNHQGYSFCHIDLDVYMPTIEALVFAYTNLLPGGIIICDDYGMETCKGVKDAIDTCDFKNKIYLPTGQMIIQKL
jgi:O-methyltransferase